MSQERAYLGATQQWPIDATTSGSTSNIDTVLDHILALCVHTFAAWPALVRSPCYFPRCSSQPTHSLPVWWLQPNTVSATGASEPHRRRPIIASQRESPRPTHLCNTAVSGSRANPLCFETKTACCVLMEKTEISRRPVSKSLFHQLHHRNAILTVA